MQPDELYLSEHYINYLVEVGQNMFPCQLYMQVLLMWLEDMCDMNWVIFYKLIMVNDVL